MKEKILIVALGLAVIYLVRNELLDRLRSREKWEKQQMKKGFAKIRKMKKPKDVIDGTDNAVSTDDSTDDVHKTEEND